MREIKNLAKFQIIHEREGVTVRLMQVRIADVQRKLSFQLILLTVRKTVRSEESQAIISPYLRHYFVG